MRRSAEQTRSPAHVHSGSRPTRVGRPGRRDGKTAEGYLLQSVGKALALVEFISKEPEGVTLTSVSRGQGLSKPTAQRLLATLLRHHWIKAHPLTGRYVLGVRLWEIGCRSIEWLGIREVARPWLEKIAAETHETVLLSILDDLEVVYIDKVVGVQPVQAMAHLGQRAPAYASGSGKALLAFQPLEVIELLRNRMERFTPNTIVSVEQLRRELADVAQRGWAVNNEERLVGVRSVAAPVRDATGNVVAAVAVASPAYRIDRARIAKVGRSVMEHAARISRDLGYLDLDRNTSRKAGNVSTQIGTRR